ncbi:hypothetical protein [Actinomadura sp. BRA 177]|uniref:hypothetical protein n=1 Tax=Actinomadura sp. BRA 177 TaxID=2745202 RepID=UPI001595FE70|nr:hypothetical protein [Actinomadura sp. BRA 177]NVI87430.1 hypothetical protein [Actinomadura sp. BRA 177]
MIEGLRLAVTLLTVVPAGTARVDRGTARAAMLLAPATGLITGGAAPVSFTHPTLPSTRIEARPLADGSAPHTTRHTPTTHPPKGASGSPRTTRRSQRTPPCLSPAHETAT